MGAAPGGRSAPLSASARRKAAARAALDDLRVFDILAEFQPAWVGTVPLGIDVPTRDLDIVWVAPKLDRFAAVVDHAYGRFPNFELRHERFSDQPAVLASFAAPTFLIELVAQTIPITQQRAYRHMIVEERLLKLAGWAAREAIRALKATGLKTEPAFARYFGLAGDPYRVLSGLYEAPADTPRRLVERARDRDKRWQERR
jgi:Domain of unknown function (DUF4269)